MAAEVVNNDVIMNEILTRIQKINVVYDAELLKLQNGLSNVFNDIAKERRHLVAEFERDREFERAYQLAEYRAAQTENDRNMLLINRAQNAEQRTALVDAHRAAQPANVSDAVYFFFTGKSLTIPDFCSGPSYNPAKTPHSLEMREHPRLGLVDHRKSE